MEMRKETKSRNVGNISSGKKNSQLAGTQQDVSASGQEDLLTQAKKTAGEVVNGVQQRADSQLNRQKETAATDLSTVVQAVRRFGETLSAEQGGPIARYAAEYGERAADKLERFTDYIREQDTRKMLNDIQNFGRRRPALLLGGAFLLGLAGARLIKSAMASQSGEEMNFQAPTTPQPSARPSL